MNEIKLSVDDQNMETVLTILNNLKSGLIADIQADGRSIRTRPAQYQPKAASAARKENRDTNESGGKYVSPALYKQRLQNMK